MDLILTKIIWKYELTPGKNIVEMPLGAEILTVQTQGKNICLWALVDPYSPKTERKFQIHGEGHEIEEETLAYVGTLQFNGGDLVFHVFEEL